MNEDNNKLTSAALICLLLCTRCFSALTFFPAQINSGTAYIIGAVTGTAVQGLLIVPAVMLAKNYRADPCTLAFGQSKNFGRGVTLAFLIYFIYEAFFDIGNLAYFTDYFFSVNMPRTAVVIGCVLTAVLAALSSSAVIGRVSQPALFGIAVTLAVIAAGSAGEMDVTRFDLAVPRASETVLQAAFAETDRCECLVLFAFLAGRTKGDAANTARRFLILKGLLICMICGMVTAVLGSFAMRTKLPVFTLAAASENLITERSDAVFLPVWVFTGLVRLANLIYCAAECIRMLIPKTKKMGSTLAAGAVPAAMALPLLTGYGWEKAVHSEHSLPAVIVLGTVLPMVMMRMCAQSEEQKARARTAPSG